MPAVYSVLDFMLRSFTKHALITMSGESSTMSYAEATVRQQSDMTGQHILSAALYARMCLAIEEDYLMQLKNGDITKHEIFKSDVEHTAHAVSAIFATAAFLESSINKFLAQEAEYIESEVIRLFNETANQDNATHSMLDSLTTKKVIIEQLEFAREKRDRNSILEKFMYALALFGKGKIDKGTSPYKDVADIINIRDALFHYKTRWVTYKGDPPMEVIGVKGIESLMKERKFPLNPLMQDLSVSFFPNKCLGYGCIKWAIDKSVQFVEIFYEKIEQPNPFPDIRNHLIY